MVDSLLRIPLPVMPQSRPKPKQVGLNRPGGLARWLGLGLAVGLANALPGADFKKVALPFLEKHCHECHGGARVKADLNLKEIRDDRHILKDRKRWRGILQQVNSGEMPPRKHTSHPTPDEITAFNGAVEESLARAEARQPLDPGRVTVRRLNRTEYNNTVRDLLAVDYNAAENFPADDIGHGFDNVGDVLSVSPVHLERYLDAAEGVAARAVLVELPKPPSRTTYSIFLEPSGYGSENGTRPVTNSAAELFVRHELKVAGRYTFRVRAGATNAPSRDPVLMVLKVGDREVTRAAVTNTPGRWQETQVELDLPAGPQRFSAWWANRDTNAPGSTLYVNEFKVVGPADTRTEFMVRMAGLAAGQPGPGRARAITEWLVTRAFRRPATREEVDRYAKVWETAQAEGGDQFEAGLQGLVRTVLCSPKFLFRLELDDRPRARKPQPLDDYQLASRLSYFLWSTLPDEDLLALAAKRQLGPNLAAQVRRMLRDPRAAALVQNFGMQWLQLQRLPAFQPDPTLFPGVNDGLKRAMLRETELFLGEVLREDRSLLDLVDADFTYVNRPLARHYGLEKVAFPSSPGAKEGRRRDDSEFVRVSLPPGQRGGLLTHASILTATSNPTRTSPVKRGKWVLEQFLGTPPPPAPPDVPALDQQKELTGTLRQRMEQHRANPACAGCHTQMDALGFAFENFDAVGRYREKDGAEPINASGSLPDGRAFAGAAELKGILKEKKDLVARNLAEKLMTYGLGRGLEYYDERALRKVLAELAAADYRFSALVISIVQSDPFRLRRGQAAEEAQASPP